MPLFIPILYALGGAVIRAAAPAAARALVNLGAKKVSTKAAQAIGGKIVTATPKVLKQLKTKGPRAKPKGKVTKPKENVEQFGPGGSTFRPMAKPKPKPKTKPKPKPKKPKEKVPEQFAPGGGGARPLQKPKPKSPKKDPKTKPPKKDPKTKPPKKDPKSPFAKKTKAEKIAADKKAAKQAQRGKDLNKKNPSRDTVGKYNVRPLSKSNAPKSGKKVGTKPLTRKGLLVRGGSAVLLGSEVLKLKGDAPQDLKIKKKNNLKPRTSGPNKGSRGSEGDRFKDKTMKKPLPVVKAPKGPSKVRPKESDQPKETFGQAFKRNRKAGKPTFTFKDKKYTTRLKEESIEKHKKKFGVTGKY